MREIVPLPIEKCNIYYYYYFFFKKKFILNNVSIMDEIYYFKKLSQTHGMITHYLRNNLKKNKKLRRRLFSLL